ncbi:hypothetical protein BGZ52_008060 [Haplosporangium bisporale]|nr:hypothetical protein BGZ52_008060 [Haplosporangium bisporale]
MNNANNNQSREHVRNESGMTSDRDYRRPGATAMRAGAEHRNTEFMIALSEHGGTAPDYSKVKGPSGSKAPYEEPVSHPHQHLVQSVHVGLKPSLTVFRSIGGGHNTGPTTVKFGGQSPASSNAPPKEFVYREQGFQRLSRGSHPTLSNSGKGPASRTKDIHLKRTDNHIQTSLGLNPALFLSQQRQKSPHIQASFGLNPALFLSQQRQKTPHIQPSSSPSSEDHAHAVPAHRDEKIKHHAFHVVNEPTDHHNHHRHQCPTDKCMDHDESHARHDESPVLTYARQSTVPMRQLQGIAHSHPAFTPLVPTSRSKATRKHKKSHRHVERTQLPIYSSSRHDRHLVTECYSEEGHHVPDQDTNWTLVTYTRPHHKVPALSHHYQTHPHSVLDTPEMNLGAMFDDSTGLVPNKPTGRADQRRLKPFHTPAPWAPNAYEYSDRYSEEHHPPSIHSFSASGSHHAHAVPAHRGGKFKHRYYEENDLTNHHSHHWDQRDDEDYSDHEGSHIHPHGGNSMGHHQRQHPGFVHYSTPHNRTVGSYDAKLATRSSRHAVQTHHQHMQAPDSPELNLGALFREDTYDHPASKTKKHKQPKSRAPAPALISERHADRIRHYHESKHSRSTNIKQTLPHSKSYEDVVGYVFEISKSLEKIIKRHSTRRSLPRRRRSVIFSSFREIDPVSRYHPAGMYLAPTSVQHGLASAYLRRPSLAHHPRHYHAASQQQQPYPPIHHAGSVGGEYASHVGIGSAKDRVSGSVETMNDLFEGLDTRPSHSRLVQGHVSEHTPVYHSGVPHVTQLASGRHIPSNTGSMPKKKTWYGVEVPVKERSRPGPLSLGFGFKEIRKAAMEGRPLHAQHASGPSTPVPSTVSAPNQHRASKVSKPIQTYSTTVASTLGHPRETVRTALSGVRMDLIEDMKLNELFAEPIGWSSSLEGSAPATSTAEAVVLAGLDGIRHLLDAALNVPARVAHALHVGDPQEEEEHVTVVHHGQRHHHSHGHSKAVTLKTSRSGSVDLSLYPEEEPNYPRDADSQDSTMHENPACPNSVSDFVIEMPYHPSRSGTHIVSHTSGNMRLGQGHHLAHHQHYHIQNHSTTPTRQHAHSDHHTQTIQSPIALSQSGHQHVQQGYHGLSASLFRASSPASHSDRDPKENVGYSRADAYSSHRNPTHPDSVMDVVGLPLALASMPSRSSPYHHGLYPEEDAGYPRTDAFSLHGNPPHPDLHDVVELPYTSSSSSSSLSSAELSTLERSSKTHSYNHSKAAGLFRRPLSPLYLYSEEQSSYPRDVSHDVASNEYDPRADDAVHQSRVYAPNPYILRKQVHEIQLDDEDQHAHHDVHSTLAESTAAAVSSSLDGFKAMLQSMHLPDMVVGALLPEAHEYLQTEQHHTQGLQQHPQDHRSVLRYKEQGHEHECEHGEGSATHHIPHSAVGQDSFVPSEHHRRHVEHFSTSSYPPSHTSPSFSSSAATAALAAKHSSPISVLPPEDSSRHAYLARPPTGFGRGADDDLGEDETVEWTKSVKTTRDFYDVEDDNVNIDELSYQNQHPGQQHVNYQGQYQQQRSRSQRHAQ